jgi:hypothetical protein
MADEKDKPKHNEDMGLTLSADEWDDIDDANKEWAKQQSDRKRSEKAKNADAEQS